jgi:hypothetical protein
MKFVILLLAGAVAQSLRGGIPGPYPDFGPFFGNIFTSGEPRRMQFALRYDF